MIFEDITGSEYVLVVDPALAQALGLQEAIILHQIAFWLEHNMKKNSKQHLHDGYWWTFNTYPEWIKNNFPFLNEKTLSNCINWLEDRHIIITGNFNKRRGDVTKWYTIDTWELERFLLWWEFNKKPVRRQRSAEYDHFIQTWDDQDFSALNEAPSGQTVPTSGQTG